MQWPYFFPDRPRLITATKFDYQKRRKKKPPAPKEPEVRPEVEMPTGKERRRKRETPQETVERFRRRFPQMEIPDPGPEPQPLEGELEPPRIEEQGVVWALETAWGQAGLFAANEEQRDKLFQSFLPNLLPKREYWERETAKGMKRLLGEE